VATIPIDEAARRMGLSVPYVRKMVRDGEIVAAAILGGVPLLDEADVDRYIREHARPTRGTTNYREG
jgi:excisionase family DNA binding protein